MHPCRAHTKEAVESAVGFIVSFGCFATMFISAQFIRIFRSIRIAYI
ncbi:YqzM family protein, partial [Geobacillus stearothermophilus]|nr:YqzM family protein [Geobacillus stearothermophilus]